jgi:hypothetical protein
MRKLFNPNRTWLRSGAALGLAMTLAACGGGMDGLTDMFGGGSSQQTRVTPNHGDDLWWRAGRTVAGRSALPVNRCAARNRNLAPLRR